MSGALQPTTTVEFDYSDSAELRPFDLVAEALTERQAYALAKLCSRLGWSDCLRHAHDIEEAKAMASAIERIRGGLEMLGVHAS